MVKLYLCYQDDGGFVLQSKHRMLLDMQIGCQRAIVSNIRENFSLTPNYAVLMLEFPADWLAFQPQASAAVANSNK